MVSTTSKELPKHVIISHFYLTYTNIGLPLLYVGGLTVPLGFARSEEIRRNHTYDYGYEQA